MTDFTFEQAWSYQCHRCHEPAHKHRLSDKGALYCLRVVRPPRKREPYTQDLLALYKGRRSVRSKEVVLNNCSTYTLPVARIPTEVGKLLAENLFNYISESR